MEVILIFKIAGMTIGVAIAGAVLKAILFLWRTFNPKKGENVEITFKYKRGSQ